MIEFKIITLSYKSWLYISILNFVTLLPYWPACTLCSFNEQLVQIPYMNTKFGQRSFS